LNDLVLDKLDLSANELTEFNAYNSNNITNLDLSANKINILMFPTRDTKLFSLNLFNNRLSVYELNLTNNSLNEIENGSFVHLAVLLYLYLNSNSLKALNEYTFENLKKLNTLDMCFNKLARIEDGVFDHLINLH